MSTRVRVSRRAALVALALASTPACAQASATAEWGTTLLVVGLVTAVAGAIGGWRFSERWAVAHGHPATLLERGVGLVVGALGGLMVPALLQLMIVAGN